MSSSPVASSSASLVSSSPVASSSSPVASSSSSTPGQPATPAQSGSSQSHRPSRSLSFPSSHSVSGSVSSMQPDTAHRQAISNSDNNPR